MSWPAPTGMGIAPPDRHGFALYNVEFDGRTIETLLERTDPVVIDWHDRSDNGTVWAEVLRLPEPVVRRAPAPRVMGRGR